VAEMAAAHVYTTYSTWQNGNARSAFFTRCITALREFNQSLLDFFKLYSSRLVFTLLYDSLNLVINAFSLGPLGAWFRRKKAESTAAVGLLHAQSTSVLSSGFSLLQGNTEPPDR